MAQVKYVKGDLITMAKNGDFNVIAHGANCFHMMGAGIAGRIAKEFPEAVEADNTTPNGKYDKLGTLKAVTISNTLHQLIVVNAYTQYHGGKSLNYTALMLCLHKLSVILDDPKYKIGLPQIGCGIAGGDWNIVKTMIEEAFQACEAEVTVVEYDNVIPEIKHDSRKDKHINKLNKGEETNGDDSSDQEL